MQRKNAPGNDESSKHDKNDEKYIRQKIFIRRIDYLQRMFFVGNKNLSEWKSCSRR